MSGIVPLVWAFKVAPVKDSIEKLVLQSLADAGDEDGCNCYISQDTIAERAMISSRSVRDRLAELEERGLIARGDQRAASHIPADRRPVVWDVMIPYTAFGDGIDSVNSFRKGKGRSPITPQNRPALPPPPPPKKRVDLGKKRPKKTTEGPESDAGRNTTPAGMEDRPESDAPAAGIELLHRPELNADNLPPTTLPSNPPQRAAEPLRDPAQDEDQPMLIVVGSATDGASETRTIGTPKARANLLAKEWWEHYESKFGPIVSKGSSRPFFALRDGVILKAIEAGYSDVEIKHALIRTGDGKVPDAIPDKQRFQRLLVQVRQHMPAAGGATVHQMSADHPDAERRAKAW